MDFVDKEPPKRWVQENSLVAFFLVTPCALYGGWCVLPNLWLLLVLLACAWLVSILYFLCCHFATVKRRFRESFTYFKRTLSVEDVGEAAPSQKASPKATLSRSPLHKRNIRQPVKRVLSDGAGDEPDELEESHVPSSSHISCACVIKCTSLTFLLVAVIVGGICLRPGNADDEMHPEGTTEVQGNLVCSRLSKTDFRAVEKKNLVGVMKYRANLKDFELNLVEELAKDDLWEVMAENEEISKLVNPKVIRANYEQTQEQVRKSSQRLFKRLLEVGYKGAFDWEAYIEGFRALDNPRLSAVIQNLEDVLSCLDISRTDMEEVTSKRFRSMKCGGISVSLTDDMAEEWRSIAREFGIRESFIFWQKNTAEECARMVLDAISKSVLSWQDIINIMRENDDLLKVAAKLEKAVDHYCVSEN